MNGKVFTVKSSASDRGRKRYPEHHWVRTDDHEAALRAVSEQQSKAYSRMKNAFIAELMGDVTGRRLLDYGCGSGWLSIEAARKGASFVLGVDAEEAILETARYAAGKAGVDDACRFMVSDGFPECSGQEPFDIIILKDVIEHIEEDGEILSGAAARITTVGSVIVSTQNAFSINYLLEGTYNRFLLGKKDWYGWDPTHLRFYTPLSLKKKLKAAGLQIAAWRSVYLIPHKIPAPRFSRKQYIRVESLTLADRVLGWVFPFNRMGWNIIVRAVRSQVPFR